MLNGPDAGCGLRSGSSGRGIRSDLRNSANGAWAKTWPHRRQVALTVRGGSQIHPDFILHCRMPTSTRLGFRDSLFTDCLTRRTAGCGPACPVVWEGRSCEAPPYPDSIRRLPPEVRAKRPRHSVEERLGANIQLHPRHRAAPVFPVHIPRHFVHRGVQSIGPFGTPHSAKGCNPCLASYRAIASPMVPLEPRGFHPEALFPHAAGRNGLQLFILAFVGQIH